VLTKEFDVMQMNRTTELSRLKLQSRFCLEPTGDTFARKGIIDSILLGCVPVLFDPRQLLLWPWHVENWHDVSIFVPANIATTTDVIEYLQQIPLERVKQLQANLEKLAPRLRYNIDYDKGNVDAVSILLEQVFRETTDGELPMADRHMFRNVPSASGHEAESFAQPTLLGLVDVPLAKLAAVKQTVYAATYVTPDYEALYLDSWKASMSKLGLQTLVYRPTDVMVQERPACNGNGQASDTPCYLKADSCDNSCYQWKPSVVLNALSRLQDDDILIWLDVRTVFVGDLSVLVGHTRTHGAAFIQSAKTARQLMKRDLLIALSIDNTYLMDLPTITLTAFAIEKRRMLGLVQTWEALSQVGGLLCEGRSRFPEHTGFEYHKHDQAILAGLCLRHPAICGPQFPKESIPKWFETVETNYNLSCDLASPRLCISADKVVLDPDLPVNATLQQLVLKPLVLFLHKAAVHGTSTRLKAGARMPLCVSAPEGGYDKLLTVSEYLPPTYSLGRPDLQDLRQKQGLTDLVRDAVEPAGGCNQRPLFATALDEEVTNKDERGAIFTEQSAAGDNATVYHLHGFSAVLVSIIKPVLFSMHTGLVPLTPKLRHFTADNKSCPNKSLACHLQPFSKCDARGADLPTGSFQGAPTTESRQQPISMRFDKDAVNKNLSFALRGKPVLPESMQQSGWFLASQAVLSLLVRPSQSVQARIDMFVKSTRWDNFGPVLGVHIRSGDACLKTEETFLSRKCYDVSKYVEQVRRMIDTYAFKSIFLATISDDTVREFRSLMTGTVPVFTSVELRLRDADADKPMSGPFMSAQDELLDIFLLSQTDGFIGTFSSNMGKVIFPLMTSSCMKPFVSLDVPWYADRGIVKGGYVPGATQLDSLGQKQSLTRGMIVPFLSLVICVVAVVMIYSGSGLGHILPALVNIFASAGLKLCMRMLYQRGFDHMWMLNSIHFGMTAIVCAAMLKYESKSAIDLIQAGVIVKLIIPISLLTIIAIMTNNFALRDLTVLSTEALSTSVTLLCTSAVVGLVATGRRSLPKLLALFLGCSIAMVDSWWVENGRWALFLVLVGSIGRSVRDCIGGSDAATAYSTAQVLTLTSSFACILLGLISMWVGEVDAIRSTVGLGTLSPYMVPVALSCLCAVFMNISNLSFIKVEGPAAIASLAALRCSVAAVLAYELVGDGISGLVVLATVLTIAGASWDCKSQAKHSGLTRV
jgi:hypothetical protein